MTTPDVERAEPLGDPQAVILRDSPGEVPPSPGPTEPEAGRRWVFRLPRGDRGILLPAAVVALYVVVAVVGPWLLDYNPRATDLLSRLQPPGSTTASGATAWLGTDAAGRDVLTQIVLGARASVTVGAAAILLSGLFGTLVGIASGYLRGPLDTVVVRLIDVQLAFPAILLAIIIAGALGRSMLNVIIALAVTNWVAFARVARGSTLSLRERDWVSAGRVAGLSTRHLLARHVVPFLAGPLIVLATLEFAFVILAEAGLSFLGLGLPSGASSWGQTVANGKDYLDTAWWISAFPGLALAGLIVAIGLLGDRLTHRYGTVRTP